MKNDGNSWNENTEGLDARDDAALWDLLGRADPPQAGPYFARRVLREVSLHAETQGASWWRPATLWRACRRLSLVAGTPVFALLLLFLGAHLNSPGRRLPLAIPAAAKGPAVGPAAVAPVSNADAEIVDAMSAGDPAATASTSEEDLTPSLAENEPAASPGPSVAANAVPEAISEQDVEVIAELDTLLKREQNRLWSDDSAHF